MIRVPLNQTIPCAIAILALGSISACNTYERRVSAHTLPHNDPIEALLALDPESAPSNPMAADLMHTNPDAALGVLATRPDPRTTSLPASH